MKLDIPNPVHCCVCVNTGDMRTRAETIVNGYAVCVGHSTIIDQHATLADVLEDLDRRNGHRNA